MWVSSWSWSQLGSLSAQSGVGYTFVANWWSAQGWLGLAGLTHMAGGWFWLVVGSFLPLSFFTFQKHSTRVKAEMGRPPQLTPNHFCHNLFINTHHKASPGEKGWKNRFNLWMQGVAKGDDTMGWQGFVAMKPSTTPATTVSSFFSVCLLFITGNLTGTIHDAVYDIMLHLAFLRLRFMLTVMFLRFVYNYHM